MIGPMGALTPLASPRMATTEAAKQVFRRIYCDLQFVLADIEAIPYRRRKYERQAMMEQVRRRARKLVA